MEAEFNVQFKQIRMATVGMIFLGTPHQGSGMASIGQVAAAVAGCVVPGAQILNRGLLKSLERNSSGLFETSNRFSNICAHMRIHSFYETIPLGPRVVRVYFQGFRSQAN